MSANIFVLQQKYISSNFLIFYLVLYPLINMQCNVYLFFIFFLYLIYINTKIPITRSIFPKSVYNLNFFLASTHLLTTISNLLDDTNTNKVRVSQFHLGGCVMVVKLTKVKEELGLRGEVDSKQGNLREAIRHASP